MIRVAREKGALGRVGREPARLHRRRAPHHRRRPVRRRRRHGDEDRAHRPRARFARARASAARGPRARASCSPRRRARASRSARRIEWATLEHLVIVCGRYKGVDERVARAPGGRGVLDRRLRALGRRARGAVRGRRAGAPAARRGGQRSTRSRATRFTPGLLDCAYYTRPAEYHGWTRARGAAVGPPRADRARAPRGGAAAHARAPARAARGRRPGRRRPRGPRSLLRATEPGAGAALAQGRRAGVPRGARSIDRGGRGVPAAAWRSLRRAASRPWGSPPRSAACSRWRARVRPRAGLAAHAGGPRRVRLARGLLVVSAFALDRAASLPRITKGFLPLLVRARRVPRARRARAAERALAVYFAAAGLVAVLRAGGVGGARRQLRVARARARRATT